MNEESDGQSTGKGEEANGCIWVYASRLTAFLLPIGLLLGLLPVLWLFCFLALAYFDDDTRPSVQQVYLADLNGNGHLDAFLIYLNEMHRVLLNDGNGRFTPEGTLMMRNYPLAIGDFHGDGRLEALLNTYVDDAVVLMCAEVPAHFSQVAPAASVSGRPFAIQESNDYGRLNVFLAGCCEGRSFLINAYNFRNSRPCLSQQGANAAALADLNGDGAADVFLANGWIGSLPGGERKRANEVWFNNGQGGFSDSGQRLGQAESLAVVVGDVTGNGFPDAVVGNRGPDEIWLNDGQGNFRDSGQRLGRGATFVLFLADLDGDGVLDLVTVSETSSRVWLNDGAGQFRMGQRIRYSRTAAVALGDVTDNGLADLLVADVTSYRVWRGAGNGRFSPTPPIGYQESIRQP